MAGIRGVPLKLKALQHTMVQSGQVEAGKRILVDYKVIFHPIVVDVFEECEKCKNKYMLEKVGQFLCNSCAQTETLKEDLIADLYRDAENIVNATKDIVVELKALLESKTKLSKKKTLVRSKLTDEEIEKIQESLDEIASVCTDGLMSLEDYRE